MSASVQAMADHEVPQKYIVIRTIRPKYVVRRADTAVDEVEMASRIPHHLANRNPHPAEGYSSFFAVMRYDSPERENILA